MKKYKAVLTTTAVVRVLVEIEADNQNGAIVEAMDAAAKAPVESMTIERVDRDFLELLTVTSVEQPVTPQAPEDAAPSGKEMSSVFKFRRYSELRGEGVLLETSERICAQDSVTLVATELLGQAGSVTIWNEGDVQVGAVSANREGWEVEFECGSVPGAFLCYSTKVGSASRALLLAQAAKKDHPDCAVRVSLLDPIRAKRNVWRVIS